MIEQFGHNRGDTSRKIWSRLSFHWQCNSAWNDISSMGSIIEAGRCIDDIAPTLSSNDIKVSINCAGITIKILISSKLCGVYIDADNNTQRFCVRSISAKCPRWMLPIVGTRHTVSPASCHAFVTATISVFLCRIFI